jgi:hypothetical protein
MPRSSVSPTAHDRDESITCAEAFIAGFRSPDTPRTYRRDLQCWLTFCLDQNVHPYTSVRRTHVEAYLCQLEQHRPPLANGTLRRRISTLSSWFTWLEDEDISVGNPAARVRRPVVTPVRSRGWTATSSPTCSPPRRPKAGRATRWCACSRSTACASPKPAPPSDRPRRLPLPADATHPGQGRQAGGDPPEPPDAPGGRRSRRGADRRTAPTQHLGQPHAAPQRRRHHAALPTGRHHPTRHPARAATLLHHHRLAPRRAAARDATRRPAHQCGSTRRNVGSAL